MAKLKKITRAKGAVDICERRMRFRREDGRLIAYMHTCDGRGTDYHIEINADELIAIASECAAVVNSNNVNCPHKLRLKWVNEQ